MVSTKATGLREKPTEAPLHPVSSASSANGPSTETGAQICIVVELDRQHDGARRVSTLEKAITGDEIVLAKEKGEPLHYRTHDKTVFVDQHGNVIDRSHIAKGVMRS